MHPLALDATAYSVQTIMKPVCGCCSGDLIGIPVGHN